MRTFFRSGMVLVLGMLALWFARPAYALQLAPATFDLRIEPGTSLKSSFLVTNDESTEQTYYFSLQKFVPQGDTGDQAFLPLSDVEGLPQWTFLSRSQITLGPKREMRVPFTITVPTSTAPQSVQEAIFVSNAAPGVKSGVGVGIRTGALVFATIGTPVPQALMVGQVISPVRSWQTALPVSFSLTLKNPGNAYQIPRGMIVVRNMFGRERARIPFNLRGARVLAGQERRFDLVWQEHAPGGRMGWLATIGEELSNSGFGPYQLSLELEGPNQKTISSLFRVSLWPVHVIALFGTLILGGFVFIWWLRRRLVTQFLRRTGV